MRIQAKIFRPLQTLIYKIPQLSPKNRKNSSAIKITELTRHLIDRVLKTERCYDTLSSDDHIYFSKDILLYFLAKVKRIAAQNKKLEAEYKTTSSFYCE